jgi:O-succinylbenzoic acid--CoA ligase
MNHDRPTSFSIQAAAAEARLRAGLVLHGIAAYSFAELAVHTRAVMQAWERFRAARDAQTMAQPTTHETYFLVAEPNLGTVAAIYAAFEVGATCVLLHHRSTPAEQVAQLALCSELEAVPGRSGARVVLFTSGSTGRSKGVVLPHTAFAASASASAANLGWRDDDRWLCCLPLAHVGGLSILMRCLAARRTAVLDVGASFDPARIAACIELERITLVSLVPTMLVRLLDMGWRPPVHLRAVLLGGAAAAPTLLARAAERGVPVLATYGMTETCAQISTQPYQTPPATDGRIGPPLPGAELRIRGGRIQARGPMLFERYLGAPAPIDEAGWFDTGDCGELDADGVLRVLGRADDTIITGGENVHPDEIEPALIEHPSIAAACVFGIADDTWGQIIGAAVLCRDQREPTALAEDLAGFLASRLPVHKRPRRLAVLPVLATSATEKLDRRHIAQVAAEHLVPVRYP